MNKILYSSEGKIKELDEIDSTKEVILPTLHKWVMDKYNLKDKPIKLKTGIIGKIEDLKHSRADNYINFIPINNKIIINRKERDIKISIGVTLNFKDFYSAKISKKTGDTIDLHHISMDTNPNKLEHLGLASPLSLYSKI